ncbi:MAG: efflux RND transporter periplasmic adaptor subunit [Bacteroidetes bacterium]|nr:efflux RND transporter periplasmic adaptor subunit [Bacteroidota bacterium]
MSSTQNQDLSFLKINRNQPEPASGNGKWFVLAGSAVLLILLVWFLTSNGSSAGPVETGVAILSTPAQENSVMVASGYIVAQRKAAVASKGTGRLETLLVIEGDKVVQGQLIGRIESQDVEAVLDQAKANLNMSIAGLTTAQTELEESKLNLERSKSLFDRNLISKSEHENAEFRNRRAVSGLASATAGIEVAKAAVRSAEVGVENTNIRAPFTGVVLTKNANVGEVISPFGAAAGSRGNVVMMADMTSLEVEAEVSESNIQKITEGMACEIMLEAYPDSRYQGFVNKVVPTADRAKATVLTKVRFRKTDEKVLPEMRAKVNFLNDKAKTDSVQESPKLTIPVASVVTRNDQKVVFVLSNGKVNERPVSLGSSAGSRVEVLSGVEAGERVVLRPDESLKSGDEVGDK